MISVLIAAYNAQDTIRRAVNSVLSQTYADLEVIVLNDGSKDDTEKQILAIEDPRVHYFKKENGGIAAARNDLFKSALGEYVIYLDADDYMEPETLEVLISKAKEKDADIVACGYRFVYEDGSTKDMISSSFDGLNMEKDPSLLLKVKPQPWNKLVRRSLMKESGLSFPDGLIFEDFCYYSCLMEKAKSVSMVENVLINYVQLGSSIMSGVKVIKPSTYDFDKVVDLIVSYYGDRHPSEVEGLVACNAREITDSILANRYVSKDEKKKAISSVLNTVNKCYPKWPANPYYVASYADRSFVYKAKRKIIDRLLAGSAYDFLLERVVK